MKNSTSIDLPKMIEHLVAEANLAYNNYLKQLTTDACLGEQIKMQKGRFCTVCKPERTDTSFEIWVDDPKRGYKHGVDESNLKPLPNGQL